MAKRLFLFLVFALSHSLVALGGKNYYEILQVSEGASEDQIKRAYRKLALKCHPYKNAGNEEANMRFAEINNAYEVLSDREKRSTYDHDGEERLKRHASGGGRDAGVNIQDIFNKRSYFMRKVQALVGFEKTIKHLDGHSVDIGSKGITKPRDVRRGGSKVKGCLRT